MKLKTFDLSENNDRQIVLRTSGLTRILDSWVDINVPATEVWEALTSFDSWGQWNSFIPVVEGKFEVGKTLKIKVISPGMKEMTFEPKVYAIEENKRISWGGGFLGFVYTGVHEFILEPIDEHTTRFRQIEKFQGPIVLLMKKMIQKTAIGYMNMNEEFKHHLEKNM